MDSLNLVSEIFVENVQKKSNTKLIFSNLRINTDVKDKLFQEKNMKRSAAIASKEAAEIYEMNVIDENIQDHKDNFTRFFCLSKNRTKSTGNDKTSIVFSAGDVSGALYKALKEFANGDINLTKIESRLTRKKAWEYNFYLDFDYMKNKYDLNDNINMGIEYLAYQDVYLRCGYNKKYSSFSRNIYICIYHRMYWPYP